MSTDLIAELRAALDAEEMTARAATPGPWHATHRGDGTHHVFAASDRKVHRDGGYSADWPQEVVNPAADAAHIAYHGPAFVLADIAAKRKLIERGGPFCTSNCDDPGNAPMDPETDWKTPLEHHLGCGAYEAAQVIAEAYGIRAEGPTT